MNSRIIIDNVPVLIGVLSAIAALVGFFADRVRRSYGFERDINHLKNDYKSLSENVAHIVTELERRLDSVERESAVVIGINQTLLHDRGVSNLDNNNHI